MAWRIEFDRAAERELGKLDPQVAKRILLFLQERVSNLEDPRSLKRLTFRGFLEISGG